MMGDNRAHSADSTVHMCLEGETECVPGPRVRRRRTSIVGKVFALVWPLSRFGGGRRHGRLRQGPRRRERRPIVSRAARGATVRQGRRALRLRARAAPARHRADRGGRRGRPRSVRRPARRRRLHPAVRARPGSCRGWPTPSCSPRRPASASTPRSCAGRSPGRWSSSRTRSATGSACTSPTSRRCGARWPCSSVPPAYVLTDGFPVDGLGVPGLAVWKGDRVAACIAAASVLAKVTRDRIMTELDAEWPAYDFKTHKGYITDGAQRRAHRARPVPGAPHAVRERPAGRRARTTGRCAE